MSTKAVDTWKQIGLSYINITSDSIKSRVRH